MRTLTTLYEIDIRRIDCWDGQGPHEHRATVRLTEDLVEARARGEVSVDRVGVEMIRQIKVALDMVNEASLRSSLDRLDAELADG